MPIIVKEFILECLKELYSCPSIVKGKAAILSVVWVKLTVLVWYTSLCGYEDLRVKSQNL